jgi:hypothetical protein
LHRMPGRLPETAFAILTRPGLEDFTEAVRQVASGVIRELATRAERKLSAERKV